MVIPTRRCVEVDGGRLLSVEQGITLLLRLGLSLARGVRIGLLFRVRGHVLQSNVRWARTLAIACRTRLPEAEAVAVVPESQSDLPFAADFKVYTEMMCGPEVRVFWSTAAAHAWLGGRGGDVTGASFLWSA